MPMMEYGCPTCSYSFELHQPAEKVSEEASCPRCGKTEIAPKGQPATSIHDDWLKYLQKNRCGIFFG